jgi:hypothetical protein
MKKKQLQVILVFWGSRVLKSKPKLWPKVVLKSIHRRKEAA